MKKLLLALLLLASPAHAQNTFFAGSPGDMIYRGTLGWAAVPGGVAGQLLMSNGPTVAPFWTVDLSQVHTLLLPTQSTNTVLGNVTGGTASPVPITQTQFLDTLGYDIVRPPTVGSIPYKDLTTGNWQNLQPGQSGYVLTSAGMGQNPFWAPSSAAATPGVIGTCLESQGVSANPLYVACLNTDNFAVTAPVVWSLDPVTFKSTLSCPTCLTSLGAITLTGDVTGAGSTSIVTTLATVNSNTGMFGSSTAIPIVTVNGKGLITAVSTSTLNPSQLNGVTYPSSYNTGGVLFASPDTTHVTATVAGSGDVQIASPGILSVIANAITNAKLALVGAATIKGNPTASTSTATDFTIQGLTARGASPDVNNDQLLIYDAAAGTLKKITPGQIASAATAGVSTFNGRSGAVSPQADDYGSISGLGIFNCTITASRDVSNNLVVALKTQSGADPTMTTPCTIPFRSSTATDGSTSTRTVTGAVSAQYNVGSTFGTASVTPFRLWFTYFDTGSTIVLGTSLQTSTNTFYPLYEEGVQSTTTCSSCATATAAGTIYTTAGLTSKPFRIAGYAEWGSGLATAGTYSSGPTAVVNYGVGVHKPGETIQAVQAMATGPQAVVGGSYVDITGCTVSITPKSAANGVALTWSTDTLTTNAGDAGQVALRRNGSTVMGPPRPVYSSAGAILSTVAANWVDLPGAAIATTYTIAARVIAGAASFQIANTNGGCVIQAQEVMG